MVCVKLKNGKVRDYIVSYMKSLAVHKAAVDPLQEAAPVLDLWMEKGDLWQAIRLSSPT